MVPLLLVKRAELLPWQLRQTRMTSAPLMFQFMNTPADLPRQKSFRSLRQGIAYAVWANQQFAVRPADVEDLLAERGVIVSREAIRLWINRFDWHFARCIRRVIPPKINGDGFSRSAQHLL